MDVMGGCSSLRGLPLHPSTTAAVILVDTAKWVVVPLCRPLRRPTVVSACHSALAIGPLRSLKRAWRQAVDQSGADCSPPRPSRPSGSGPLPHGTGSARAHSHAVDC